MKTTAIASQKGGTGKTTTSLSLAAGLARRGEQVLLVDVDSQANSSKVLLPQYQQLTKEQTVYQTILQQQSLPIHETPIPNLFVAPSHILLSNTDIELTSALDHREARLKRELDKVKDRFKYVLIDCPPALGWLTLNALTASDQVIVVVSPGYFELDSIVQISKTIAETQKYFNVDLVLRGILFNLSDSTVNTSESLKVLRQLYSSLLLKSIIPRNTDLRDSHMNKQDIFSYNPTAKAALAYKKLIEELF